jgi:predicted SAM-dependent methyltransferase
MALGDDLLHVTTDATGAARRAWWHMQPRFEGEIDMCNFIFELRDFKQLMKHALKPKASYDKIAAKLRRLRRNRPNRVPNMEKDGLDKTAAGLYLTYELALKPLISDLTAIHAQLATLVREAQQEFKIAGSEDQKSHFSEELGKVESLTTYTNNNYWTQLGTRRKTLFTATMHYTYAYKMRSTVDAFVKYWGLSPTPETFWNAIPFSFIVDYFVKIGDSIHAMQKDRNVSLRMHDYAESLLTYVRTGYIVKNDDRLCSLVLDGQLDSEKNHDGALISGVEGTIYERRITRPNYGPALPRLKLPSGKQAATMGAIVRCLF